jgi:hypothetical protein
MGRKREFVCLSGIQIEIKSLFFRLGKRKREKKDRNWRPQTIPGKGKISRRGGKNILFA